MFVRMILICLFFSTACESRCDNDCGFMGQPLPILVDPTGEWNAMGSAVSGTVKFEVDAFLPKGVVWKASHDKILHDSYHAATLSGTAISSVKLTFSALNGRTDARHIAVELPLPATGTVMAGWTGTDLQMADLAWTAVNSGAYAPSQPPPNYMGPGLSALWTVGKCPRLLYTDMAQPTPDLVRLTLTFSESVQPVATEVQLHPWNFTPQTPIPAQVDVVSERALALTFAATKPGQTSRLALDDLVPGTANPKDFSCAPAAPKILVQVDTPATRVWFADYGTARYLAFEHAQFVGKHPEYKDVH